MRIGKTRSSAVAERLCTQVW